MLIRNGCSVGLMAEECNVTECPFISRTSKINRKDNFNATKNSLSNWHKAFVHFYALATNGSVTLNMGEKCLHRPPKVWHHLEHRRHARVLMPTLEYSLSIRTY